MDITVNYSLFNDLFAVPSIVAEKHLKFASHAQLKVLLYVLKFKTEAPSCDKLDITESELKEAILYWQQAGVFGTNQTNENQKDNKKPAPVKAHMPDRKQVAQRAAESKEIAVLIQQAEIKLGRVLRQNEASALVYLMDDEGMNPPVLLMLIDYAISQNRASVSFIEKTAVDWMNRGINTANKAEKEIIRLHSVKTDWGIVARIFGISDRRPSKKEEELAYKWIDEWQISEPMLHLAYDKCVDATGKFTMAYISKIIDGWYKSGFKTLQDVENNDKKTNSQMSSSYNIDLFEQMINED